MKTLSFDLDGEQNLNCPIDGSGWASVAKGPAWKMDMKGKMKKGIFEKPGCELLEQMSAKEVGWQDSWGQNSLEC